MIAPDMERMFLDALAALRERNPDHYEDAAALVFLFAALDVIGRKAVLQSCLMEAARMQPTLVNDDIARIIKARVQ